MTTTTASASDSASRPRRPTRRRFLDDMNILCLLILLLTTLIPSSFGQKEQKQNDGEEEGEEEEPTFSSTLMLENQGDYVAVERRHYAFAVVPKSMDLPFYEPVQKGCEEEARDLTQQLRADGGTERIEVECYFDGPKNHESQGEFVKNLFWGNTTHGNSATANTNSTATRAPRQIDGLAIAVYNEEEMTPIINQIKEEFDIPVITFDSDASKSQRQYYVGTNNSFMGRQLARAMETLKPNGGPYGIITTLAPNTKERVMGILEELNHQSNWHNHWKQVPGSPYNGGDGNTANLTKTFQQMEEWVLHHDKPPKVIVSVLAQPMKITVDPITQTSYSMWSRFVEKYRHLNITFLCGDAMQHQLDMLQSNYVDGLVGQLPYDMGTKCVSTLWKLTLQPNDDTLGDPETFEDGDDDDLTDNIGTNVISHVHIPLKLPPVKVDNNLVGDLKYIGWVLYGVVAAMAVLCVVWAFTHGKVRVVRVAQPRFLIMIALGVLIMGSCMIPLGMDDDGGTRADCFDSSVELGEHCTVICMSVPWLASIGFTIIFSALYSKTRRINMIFKSGSAFGRVKVSERDVLAPFVVLLGANVLILLLWTLIDPLTYTRINDYGRDGWNRVISTHGVCQSENQEYFLIPLAIVNIGVLVLANWQAYEARDIESEFSETKYIGICMASMLQALVTGIPVLFIVSQMPKAYYVVLVLLIFILCIVVLMVMFVPKMVFAHQYMGMSDAEQRQFMTNVIRKAAKSSNSASHSTPGNSKYAGATQQYTYNHNVPGVVGGSNNQGATDNAGSHYDGKPTTPYGANVPMSSLTSRPSMADDPNNNHANTPNTPKSETDGRDQSNGVSWKEEGDNNSSSSDDTGLVFYRKTGAPPVGRGSETNVVKKTYSNQSSGRNHKDEQAAATSMDRNDYNKNNALQESNTNVRRDVITEGDEEEATDNLHEEQQPRGE